MKSLKECGVPFGARIVFRMQWAPLIAMVLVFALSLPFVAVWGLAHESGLEFIDGVTEMLREKTTEIQQHRNRLIAMYAKHEDA